METAIRLGIESLSQVIEEFLAKDIEILRICRTAVFLKASGIVLDDSLYDQVAKKCLKLQKDDGGWIDVEETLWCTAFLNLSTDYSDSVQKACQWLVSQGHKESGWGKSERDIPRIPVTALLLIFLPQIASANNFKWLEDKWHLDLETEPSLTYKAAFILMAFRKNNYHPEDKGIISRTILWLADQQNEDGGWGPWKNHPVGSDPWCTGICMVSLLQYQNDLPRNVLLNGMKWIKDKQLTNGLWAYHYIEDGSAWALYALAIGFRLLGNGKND